MDRISTSFAESERVTNLAVETKRKMVEALQIAGMDPDSIANISGKPYIIMRQAMDEARRPWIEEVMTLRDELEKEKEDCRNLAKKLGKMSTFADRLETRILNVKLSLMGLEDKPS